MLGCLFNYYVPNMVTVSGQGKLNVIAAGSLFLVVAAVYFLYGPDEFPWFREREGLMTRRARPVRPMTTPG